MKARRLRACLLAGAASFVVGVGSSASAQTQPAPATTQSPNPTSDQSGTIAEIVVTAQKRSENLQNVPISISAITADRAAKLGVSDGQSLVNLVPGLNFERQGGGATPYIRGIGNTTSTTGDEPSVAFYVDDVYIPAGASSILNFNSIDRIEVLKGPQGTLFGRNATGGVMSVYTKNPTQDFHLDANAGYANYDTYSGSAYVSGGLTDTLSANFSAYGSKQNHGWGRNITTGNPSYLSHDYGGRFKLLWKPDSATRVLLNADYDKTYTQEGVTYQPATGTAALYITPGGYSVPPGTGFYDTADDTDPAAKAKQRGVSLSAQHDFSAFTFKSISAYRKLNALQAFGYDPVPAVPGLGPILNVSLATSDSTITQEFQLLSPSGSRFQWVAGFFFFHDVVKIDPLRFVGLFAAQLAPGTTQYAANFANQLTNSYAGYGQATYNIFGNTRLTGGLRYTIDKRRLSDYTVIDGGPPVVASNSPQSAKFSKLTWRAAIDQKVTPDILLYAAYNRGFKSGLFNQTITPLQPIGELVKPEVIDAYTVGIKSELFGHTLRFNAEGFVNLAKNLQLQRYENGANVLSNAAKTRIYGIDVDIDFKPVRRLTLSWNFEVEHGRYLSLPSGYVNQYNPATGGNPSGTQQNLAGNTTIQTPAFTSSVSAIYEMPTSLGPLTASVSYFHGGNYFFDYDNGLGQTAPSKPSNDKQFKEDQINASLVWVLGNGRYDVKLWGKNLTNDKSISFGTETLFDTQWSAGAPRTYGVTLGLHI